MHNETWIPVRDDSDFPLENLPFGVARLRGSTARVVVRIGDYVLDLAAADIAPDLTAHPRLNPLMASGRAGEVRERAGSLLRRRTRPELLHHVDEVDVLLPVRIGDFVDFYSSIDHARNLGRIFRPEGDPLPPNWRYMPTGYHGRSGSIVPSGTPIVRPHGLVPDRHSGRPRLLPTCALDFELEVGFFVGGAPASRIAPDDAGAHVFGAVLCNDWSARDIQQFEHQPLGPNLGKSFATTISPWVVTLDALEPFFVAPPAQNPEPDQYLRATKPWGIDLRLEVARDDETVATTNFGTMYWTFAQQLAHMTVNGATVSAGDFFASGTVSGREPSARGSLIEQINEGTADAYLADGETVTLRGHCEGARAPRVGFGDASATIVSAVERI
jgi:fumarylacetoacetase